MMTTGWGASRDPAPAVAYRLAAAVADGDEEAAGKLWADLDGAARARVIVALGAQARLAVHTAWGGTGLAGAVLEGLAAGVSGVLRGCEARGAAVRALAGRPGRAVPGCDGCARPAVALAAARVAALQLAGFSPAQAAEICRRSARR